MAVGMCKARSRSLAHHIPTMPLCLVAPPIYILLSAPVLALYSLVLTSKRIAGTVPSMALPVHSPYEHIAELSLVPRPGRVSGPP